MQFLTATGRVVRDPEMRYLQDGTAVTSLTLAVSYGRKNPETGYRETMWLRCSFWRKAAEVVNQYATKGTNLWVGGEFRTDDGNPQTFTTKDGNVRASFEINVDKFEFLGGGNDDSEGGYTPSAPATTEPAEDDIPF